MKTYLNLKKTLLLVIIGIAFLIIFFTQVFPSKISRAEKLINEGNIREAKILIGKYLKDDENNKDMLKLYSKVNYQLVKDSCKTFEAKGQFGDAIYLIEKTLPEIKDSNFKDSIKSLLFDLSLQGAVYYKLTSNYLLAYNCIVPLLETNYPLNATNKNLTNEITKMMLTGIWEAYSKKEDIIIQMDITAVSSKTYFGKIHLFGHIDKTTNTYEHFYQWTLSNCSYENMRIAAAYNLPSFVKTTYYKYDTKSL